MAQIDSSLLVGAPTLQQRLSLPNRWSNLNSTVSGVGDMAAQQYQARQGNQQSLAQSLLSAKLNRLLYPGMSFGGPDVDAKLDSLISQNPYARNMLQGVSSSLSQQGQGQQSQPMPGISMAGGGMMPGGQPGASGDASGGGDGIQPLTGGGMSPFNPAGGGSVVTGQSLKTPMGSFSLQNPAGEAAIQSAKSQAEANVAVPKEYATSMAKTQALAQENLARDNTQMMSVFQTLKNLHDIHSKLADQNLAGTHLGEVGSHALPFLGDIAALTGNKPENLQNAVMSPENQNLIGQFQAGRNEGITRAIQPLQNQVDKTGSSRISESLMKMTEGEYGTLKDTRPQFEGKTLGTAKTLYRITLASQLYADQLKAQGLQLNSKDKNFDPDKVASDIFNNAQNIKLSPAQEAQFNQYANQILGTEGKDYAGGGSLNPVTNSQPTQQVNQQTKQLDTNTAQQILQQAGGDKNKARMIAKQMGYQF